MAKLCTTFLAVLALGGSLLTAGTRLDSAPVAPYMKEPVQASQPLSFFFPPAFERERGVRWDGHIAWKTGERVWVFAAALERSLKGITRADSPFHLAVAVVRAEKGSGRFIVEFGIQDASGECLEVVQVEGVGPQGPAAEEALPTVAVEIVTTFRKSVLQ